MKNSITFIAVFLLLSLGLNAQTYLTPHHVIAAGEDHSMSICNDLTVRSWGYNSNGQLGIGVGINTVLDTFTPMNVIQLTGITGIAGGGWFSLALKNDSTVWAWGSNIFGEIGDGTTNERDTPTHVSGLTGIKTVSAGWDFSLALKSDGTVWGWGDNGSYQLGDGTTNTRETPVQNMNLSNVADIAGGGQFHALALKYNGTVWSWGGNQNGQLGYGTTSLDSNQVGQVSTLSNIKAIGCGYYHSLAVKSDGTVWAWGKNENGQLGNGTVDSGGCNCDSIPVQVSGLTNVIAVAGGLAHSIALKDDSTVWAWGYNQDGELGNSTISNSGCDCNPVPAQVMGLTGVIAIAAGWEHNMALKNDGTVWEWGYNLYGQLGNGDWLTHSDRPSPVSVHNLCLVLSAGIPEVQNNSSIKVFPNPASTLLNIHNNSQIPTHNSQLIITDLLGNEVYKEMLTGIDNTISISSWNAGIYFYEVRSNTNITRGKFVKE